MSSFMRSSGSATLAASLVIAFLCAAIVRAENLGWNNLPPEPASLSTVARGDKASVRPKAKLPLEPIEQSDEPWAEVSPASLTGPHDDLPGAEDAAPLAKKRRPSVAAAPSVPDELRAGPESRASGSPKFTNNDDPVDCATAECDNCCTADGCCAALDCDECRGGGRGVNLSVCVPDLPAGPKLTAGLLYLRPSSESLGWGVLTTEKNYASPVPIATPYWDIQTLEPGYQPGFQFGASYAFADTGRDVRADWQHLRTDTDDAGWITTDGQWISPFSQTGPPTAAGLADMYWMTGVGDLHYGRATAEFAYDVVNIDFGQNVAIGPLNTRLFAGVSMARLKQQIRAIFYGDTPAPGTPFPDNVPRTFELTDLSTFGGVGPRLGFESTFETRRGFRVSAQLAAALLVGNTQPSQYQMAATSPELAELGIAVNREWIASDQFTHAVFSTDAKVGVGYTWVLPNCAALSLDGGYQAAFYANPFSGYQTNENILPLEIGSLSTGSVRKTQSNFTVDGFFLTTSLKW